MLWWDSVDFRFKQYQMFHNKGQESNEIWFVSGDDPYKSSGLWSKVWGSDHCNDSKTNFKDMFMEKQV